ncbi:cupredoxin domain-containing protein [Celeribacter litoreus]|uniref:hypothetical protein n=1 Tax=Celeribacter litoreus TaxID=2876714 RepID=UPI001CD0087F|nr:hypothetical protein [Celeribacter litoreus]MCA0044438.1 hypothetical protein [Celeribacter litoreus]
MRYLTLAAALFAATSAFADDHDEEKIFGMAGILSATNSEDLPLILLSAGQPLAEAPLKLKSGTYYEIEIEADGSQELALAGADFFRAIWIDEIVIEGIEIRPLGVDSFEFDEAGTMEVSFVAIKPGSYELRVPQSKGDLQRLSITIE